MENTALLRSIQRWLMCIAVLLAFLVSYLFSSVPTWHGAAVLLICAVVAVIAVVHLFVSFVRAPPM